ncbi:hypothetical protein [Plastoroseomonas hellenica]|uniref:hypothetical protein n=1 Tax=Plastoroseomonas hellenica TaxID=2687306 RepID=UPI001BAA2321|nr:hypothetical protein [Plastoroseomonas hellenica]MBR0645980.1 hypothetical protein [Plastoroseomonas hellenica]
MISAIGAWFWPVVASMLVNVTALAIATLAIALPAIRRRQVDGARVHALEIGVKVELGIVRLDAEELSRAIQALIQEAVEAKHDQRPRIAQRAALMSFSALPFLEASFSDLWRLGEPGIAAMRTISAVTRTRSQMQQFNFSVSERLASDLMPSDLLVPLRAIENSIGIIAEQSNGALSALHAAEVARNEPLPLVQTFRSAFAIAAALACVAAGAFIAVALHHFFEMH